MGKMDVSKNQHIPNTRQAASGDPLHLNGGLNNISEHPLQLVLVVGRLRLLLGRFLLFHLGLLLRLVFLLNRRIGAKVQALLHRLVDAGCELLGVREVEPYPPSIIVCRSVASL